MDSQSALALALVLTAAAWLLWRALHKPVVKQKVKPSTPPPGSWEV